MAKRDPNNPTSFNHRYETLSTGQKYHFVDEYDSPTPFNPKQTPTLLCIHGFPDLWYGWRHQIGPWVKKGWRVIVPDMLGYGDTDKPADVRYYTTKSLSGDMAALLDLIGVTEAIIIGHDWGSEITWRFSMWYPERCRAVVNMAIPYVAPTLVYRPLEEAVRRMPDFGYQLYFSDPNSTKEIESHLETFFAALYQAPGSSLHLHPMQKEGKLQQSITNKSLQWDPLWHGHMKKNEIDYILDKFRAGGMNGPLNYYRTTKLRFDDEKQSKLSSELRKDIPWLMIYGSYDKTTSEKHVAGTKTKVLPQLEIVRLENIGHWVMVEAAGEVTNTVMKFVERHITGQRAKL